MIECTQMSLPRERHVGMFADIDRRTHRDVVNYTRKGTHGLKGTIVTCLWLLGRHVHVSVAVQNSTQRPKVPTGRASPV